jgi:hypothetical protein
LEEAQTNTIVLGWSPVSWSVMPFEREKTAFLVTDGALNWWHCREIPLLGEATLTRSFVNQVATANTSSLVGPKKFVARSAVAMHTPHEIYIPANGGLTGSCSRRAAASSATLEQ